MALEIKQNIGILAPNVKTKFNGFGGVPPYAYSVEIDGAGGSIDPLTGEYTAPGLVGSGIDIIKVVDFNLDEVTTTISIMNHIGLVCSIIQDGLGLSDDQVYIYNQNFTIPNDHRIYVPVGILNSKVFANSNRTEEIAGDFVEIQSSNFQTTLSIDLMSRDIIALETKEFLVMALNSHFSKSVQEANNFNIGSIPSSFVNLSNKEGPSILNRFNFSINIMYTVKKVKIISYFDNFSDVEVLTNK